MFDKSLGGQIKATPGAPVPALEAAEADDLAAPPVDAGAAVADALVLLVAAGAAPLPVVEVPFAVARFDWPKLVA
jgi:hypothetical protein